MSFKIDAKERFTVITPESRTLDATFAADLAEQCKELVQKGSHNFIVDLALCQNALAVFLEPIVLLSSSLYEQGISFVIAHPPTSMIELLKEADAIDSLNYAPTFIEAIDIVNMEILERELFSEE